MRSIINIAHRGYTRVHPDNTLEAFRAALELGADGVEFDVQETADGGFVVYHDDDIGGRPLLQQSLSEVRSLHIKGKYQIPTLEEALDLLGRETVKMVELKQVRSVGRCLDIIRSRSDLSRLVVVSFSSGLIDEVKRLYPDMFCAVIGGDDADRAAPAGTGAYLAVRCAEVTAELVSRAHDSGSLVFVWDCQDEAGVRRALPCDIDGVISDYPDVVKELTAG